MGLKSNIQQLQLVLHSWCSMICCAVLFCASTHSIAQNSDTILYIESEIEIYGVTHICVEKIEQKSTIENTIFVTEESDFFSTETLTATIAYIEKERSNIKKLVLQALPTKIIADRKPSKKNNTTIQKPLQYQKNTLPFSAEHFFKLGTVFVLITSNSTTNLKNQQCLLPQPTKSISTPLELAIKNKENKINNYFASTTTIKAGISQYKRPPPFFG